MKNKGEMSTGVFGNTHHGSFIGTKARPPLGDISNFHHHLPIAATTIAKGNQVPSGTTQSSYDRLVERRRYSEMSQHERDIYLKRKREYKDILRSTENCGTQPVADWLNSCYNMLSAPVILLRNLDPHNGLCNGTMLMIRAFQDNAIDAEIVGGQHAGKRVFIPRIPLSPSEDISLPFKFKRKQFPIRLSFAMTINKAQGQTIPTVGIYLPEPVFAHGQLYVALSRGVSRQTTRILAKPNKEIDPTGKSTKNIVYRDVLEERIESF